MCITIELAVQGENINREKYDANHYTHILTNDIHSLTTEGSS